MLAVVSGLGGLIQTAVGSLGGRGILPLKRFGLTKKALLRVSARCWKIVGARP